ncbi:TetR/AcrR family transcriptional regulator [Antarcticimicrobium luteum]|uniref:TetR/AcrR family transcriptional regulator n=1 Tax=Antarcticimicrobium luteum TaxID=2547397 RepID=A0A4R5UZ63_9RHOB|nr:TetR/AcrR family transcriptional regulator [Antarcticimicrobium luteum]TDK44551.1 TetR/AcrR family transcriptional regulator [Antarcticimicrobium luteum]
MENAETSAVVTRRGRPVVLAPEERQKRIFDALEAVYRENGLDGASMDALAGRAGMSKRTIYALFPSRAALLQAYLEQYGGGFLRPVPAQAQARPLAERLRLTLSPELGRGGFGLPLEILRGLVAETPAAPGIARDMLRRTSDLCRCILIEELERGCDRGEVEIDDVPAAAALLLDMLRPWPVESLLDPGRLPDEAAMTARLDLAISVFLHGTARRG